MAGPDLDTLSGLMDEAKCFALVRRHRWPDGVRCPACGSGAVIRDGRDEIQPQRQRYRCKSCAGRFDDLSGTVLAFVPRWVEELAARYNALGPAALGDQRRRNGRAASLLTEDVLTALAERGRTPPDDGGLWSGPKVAAWMAGQLGLERVHPQRGWEALKRIDWSLQAPRPRHPRAATPEQRAAFKGGSMPLSPRPGRRIPISRSRFGQRTSTAWA